MTAANTTEEEYFKRLIRLLELEAEAEKSEALLERQNRTPEQAEASGNSLIHLAVRQQDAGLGGRILLTLGKRNQGKTLPWIRLRIGSPVILSEERISKPDADLTPGWRGIVSRLQKDTLQVAFSQWPEAVSENPTFRLDHSSDEISRQRQRKGLEAALNAADNRLAGLRAVLLGKQPPSFHSIAEPQFENKNLNESQRTAVKFALTADDFAIIHGPPGTGKTTTLIELILQIIKNGQSVLAVAPSNLAVDNILERLLVVGMKPIRLGHPARVLPELQKHTLDEMVESHPDIRLAHKWIREAYILRNEASKFTRARPEPGFRQANRQEARQLLDDARKIERQVIEYLMASAQIVCATTTGLDHDLLKDRVFDWCIMDEASQSTEPGAWISLQFANRLILAGDPYQLPPTVISTQAAAEGFNVSLLERMMGLPGVLVSHRLTIQYRMHQDIMTFPSKEFYEGSLIADLPVGKHLLQDLPGIRATNLTGTALHFIDTAGASYDEKVELNGESLLNPLEADLVVQKVRDLLDTGLVPHEIAVISPYSAQVRLLRGLIKQPGIEIDSVDGFQGREKETVIVSLVRSNHNGEIGFLKDVRRMNVALTRARRKLIIVGDSATVTAHPFYDRMVVYFESIGAYHSVWEDHPF